MLPRRSFQGPLTQPSPGTPSNEYGAMVVDPSVRHVPTKDVPKPVLVGVSDMRVRRLILEFNTLELGASR